MSDESWMPLMRRAAALHPYPLVFATVSGAHLYGFPSPDSDFDLRGAHLLPLKDCVGLRPGEETVASESLLEGAEIDLVTHDLKKFIGLLLKKNGYALEQLLSPLVVETSPIHDEMKSLAPGLLTRHHAHHYLGFAQTQRRLLAKERKRVKPLLYVYRALLTGIHLMRSGEVCANLPQLNEVFDLPQIPDLVAQKIGGTEKGELAAEGFDFHERELDRLEALLREERERSRLPEAPSVAEAFNDILIRARLGRGPA